MWLDSIEHGWTFASRCLIFFDKPVNWFLSPPTIVEGWANLKKKSREKRFRNVEASRSICQPRTATTADRKISFIKALVNQFTTSLYTLIANYNIVLVPSGYDNPPPRPCELRLPPGKVGFHPCIAHTSGCFVTPLSLFYLVPLPVTYTTQCALFVPTWNCWLCEISHPIV